jgi:hypothetical protein
LPVHAPWHRRDRGGFSAAVWSFHSHACARDCLRIRIERERTRLASIGSGVSRWYRSNADDAIACKPGRRRGLASAAVIDCPSEPT